MNERENDPVNPNHYKTKAGTESIDLMEAFELELRAYVFNAVKYLLRNGKKDIEDPIVGLEKARWYIDREIKRLKDDPNYWNQIGVGDNNSKEKYHPPEMSFGPSGEGVSALPMRFGADVLNSLEDVPTEEYYANPPEFLKKECADPVIRGQEENHQLSTEQIKKIVNNIHLKRAKIYSPVPLATPTRVNKHSKA